MHKDINVNVSGPVQPSSTYKTIVLKGNLPFALQVSEPNMKYVIKHDFDLGGETVTVPANCVLEFDGGSLSNGILKCSTLKIENASLTDVNINPINGYLTIINSKLYSENLINFITAKNSSLLIKDCHFEGVCQDSFLLSDGFDNTIDIHSEIYDSYFIGTAGAWCIRITGVYEELEHHLYAKLSNITVAGNNSPYSVVGYTYAEVTGGDFSKSLNAGPNLYNCFNAKIIGGYYHDMFRGATLGGYLGKNGLITDVLSENLTGHGITIDYANSPAEGEEKDTSEGFAIICNNLIKNCRYGIFTQTPNLQIVHNRVMVGALSERFGIRVNCQRKKRDAQGNITSEPIDNPNIQIIGNVIDDLEDKVTPIYLGENVKADCRNNTITSKRAYAGYDSSLFAQINTLFITEEMRVLTPSFVADVSFYDNIVIGSDITNGFTLRINAFNVPTVKKINIVNLSNVRIYLNGYAGENYLSFTPKQLNKGEIATLYINKSNDAIIRKTNEVFGDTIIEYNNVGDFMFNTSLGTKGKPTWGTGIDNYWLESDCCKVNTPRIGTFASAPLINDIYEGFGYFCTDLNRLMYHFSSHYPTKIQEIAVAVGTDSVTTSTNLVSGKRYSVYISKSHRRAIYACKNSTFAEEDSILLAETTKANDTLYFDTPDTSVYPYLHVQVPSGHSSQVNFIIYEAINWFESDGAVAGVKRSGTTEERPSGFDIYIGFKYFDTSIGINKPIYASAINGDTVTWVDATGTPV